jgi:hypothetical protein
MQIEMTNRYKIIPVLLLAFYGVCTLCPERLIPRLAVQTAAASEAHDCHNRGTRKPATDCRIGVSEFLPAAETKISHVLAVYALFLPPDVLSLAFDVLFRLRPPQFSTAGPPPASLRINLRI